MGNVQECLRVGACGKSNNVVMPLPPSKLARKFPPSLLAPTAVPRIPNAYTILAANARRVHARRDLQTPAEKRREEEELENKRSARLSAYTS